MPGIIRGSVGQSRIESAVGSHAESIRFGCRPPGRIHTASPTRRRAGLHVCRENVDFDEGWSKECSRYSKIRIFHVVTTVNNPDRERPPERDRPARRLDGHPRAPNRRRLRHPTGLSGRVCSVQPARRVANAPNTGSIARRATEAAVRFGCRGWSNSTTRRQGWRHSPEPAISRSALPRAVRRRFRGARRVLSLSPRRG